MRNSTKLMLVNAIYFKALWKEAFEKLNTIESDFKISKVRVNTDSNPKTRTSENKLHCFPVVWEIQKEQ